MNTMYFFYVKVVDGIAQSGVIPTGEAQQLVGGARPVDSMNAADLAAHNLVRLEAPPVPKDGYLYFPGSPTLVDGKWTFAWAQQPTPGRETTLAMLARQRRADRDVKIREFEWRYARYARNERLGLPQLDTLPKMDAYVQELANMPNQPNFPWEVVWPVYNP